ncbi:MAG: right-handed parallel beta-helix repeat-containing protein [Spirochaetes bacterium]|nr:right-handed parallel beta-helix repeat-containing protein [Spirochaetota bacterium]
MEFEEYPYYDGNTYPQEINRDQTIITGNVFYISPNDPAADISNPGTEALPWTTLQAVIESGKIETMEPSVHPYYTGAPMIVKNPGAPVKAGDTIILRNGYHGDIYIQDYFNSNFINVIADTGHTPQIARLRIQSGCRWRFKGLTISPAFAPEYFQDTLVFFMAYGWHGPVSYITIDNCTLFSVWDSSSWSAADWNNFSCSGISSNGSSVTIRNNYLKNINFGITIANNFALVENNTIENFSGDGMRGLGNDLFFEYNIVKNCYAVNANHDDGFQSWMLDDPPRERVVLRGNQIINYADPDQPFRGTLQGIGCFDGYYINWVIENNVVITDHWHGISLYGAINCRIMNNTVIDLNNARPGPPWIAIVPHKNGTPNRNCLIRNNIMTNIIKSEGVVEDHNYIIENYTDYTDLFVDPAGFNLKLKPGSPVIDAGISQSAPLYDRDKKARPNGAGYDPGAYEYYP